MIHPPPDGPLWGSEIPARAEILRDTSGEHCNRSSTGGSNDSSPSCRPSLGLGNTSQSRVYIVVYFVVSMCVVSVVYIVV